VNDYNGCRSMGKRQKPQEPDLGRFSDPALVVLTCIADVPKHGYAILQESESLGLPLSLGTLYGALNRLERLGLVEVLPSTDRRRPYRLTKTGAGHLKARLTSLTRLVRYGSRKLQRA
jgi:DNA-binding PadR family transcriptional regulator